MSESISPWNNSASRISPDGCFRAVIADAREIRMGAPTSGELVISENRDFGRVIAKMNSCNPSLVWSTDSKSLAVPQWNPNLEQCLCIVSVPDGRIRRLAEKFRVLELMTFKEAVVRGVDSPIHLPAHIEISVSESIGPEAEPTRGN